MNRCPITYEPIEEGLRYSARGLRLLSRNLKQLQPLPFSAEQQREQAGARAEKMSVQGVQPKLSAVLNVKEGRFDIVDRNGRFILKPQCDFREVPENEALTMTLAETIGIEVPVHGLLYSSDESFTYFIRRFDRTGRGKKAHTEDFAQLSGQSRETKYRSTMERVTQVIQDFCTFPMVENVKLFRLTIFSFLIGNEDMHLKNFSIISKEGKIELSPAYDLVNSTIALPNAREELALPLKGKKSNLSRADLVDYFAAERLGLTESAVEDVLTQIREALPGWEDLIGASFLSDGMKESYRELLNKRRVILGI